MLVRDATPADASACAAVHAPYVTDTAITFEYEPPTAAQMAERIADAQRAHAWKFGAWHDVTFVQRPLEGGRRCPGRAAPAPTRVLHR